jgi:hypothetical protein
MQAEASAALTTRRREERIERFTPDAKAHAAAIVEKRISTLSLPDACTLMLTIPPLLSGNACATELTATAK